MSLFIIFRICVLLSATLIAFASLLKSVGLYSSFFLTMENLVGGDKALHLIVSFSISFGLSLVTRIDRNQPLPTFFSRTFICLLVLFSADELLQLLSIYRNFSYTDLTLNYLGLILGWTTGYVLMKSLPKVMTCVHKSR